MFKFIRDLSNSELDNFLEVTHTKHLTNDRKKRLEEIQGLIVKGSIIDKGHKNGPEVHLITDKAECIVVNKISHRLITVLFLRPAQLKRYFKGRIENEIYRCAQNNTFSGKNNI